MSPVGSRQPPPPPPRTEWSYFLDLDGTLVDIAAAPGAIQAEASLLDLIAGLQAATGGAVALISGRSLSDLETRLAGLRLPMAGQHGLERRDAVGRLWIHPVDPCLKLSLRQQLDRQLDRHPALLLEDKGLTLALHYRSRPSLASHAHRLIRRLADGTGGILEVQPGKRVVELKPAGVDKGTAVAEYLAESPFQGRRPVFIGDDLTDEQGFAAVNGIGGVSVKVGRGGSAARYRLADVAGVHAWLARVAMATTR